MKVFLCPFFADMFLQVLELFHVGTEDIYIPSYLDMSQVEFRTTKEKRQQIDYVFRHLLTKNKIELWEARWVTAKSWNSIFNPHSQSYVQLEGGDWYAIY